jgi:hypothetical protein
VDCGVHGVPKLERQVKSPMNDTTPTAAKRGGLSTDSLAISLRAFVTDINAKPAGRRNWRPSPASKWTLVFDTETTTDGTVMLTNLERLNG